MRNYFVAILQFQGYYPKMKIIIKGLANI